MSYIESIESIIKENAKKAAGKYHFFKARKIRKALEKFGGANQIEAEKYLDAYSKNGVSDFSSYKIYMSNKRNWANYIFSDTEYSFIFWKNGETDIARIGFDLEYEMAIKVKQIQGKNGYQNALMPFRWEKMLIKVVEDWASDNGFKQSRIQRAEDSRYWKYIDETDETITSIMTAEGYEYHTKLNKRLKMKYDITAKRCGYRYDEGLECFVKDL